MSTLDRICALLKAQGKKQKELTDYLGISKNAFTDWKSGRITSYTKHLPQIAEFLDVSVDYLVGRQELGANRGKGVQIPVLGKVIAGIPVDAVEDVLDYEEITSEMAAKGDYFALQIKGDSMEPKFSEGDVIIVRKQSYAETGDIAVVLVNGGEATVKKIKKRPDGIMLVPTNPNYEVMFYNNTDIQKLPVTIIGKVVELRAKF